MSDPKSSSPESRVLVPAGFAWTFPARIIRWIDGDSCYVDIARSASEEQHGVELRLDGINAVELKTAFGQEAKAYAESLAPAGAQVMLHERNKREKFGRELARVFISDGREVNGMMLLAKASDGVTPLAIPYNP